MSKLIETNRAYKKLTRLLDQEIRKGGANSKTLEDARKSLDVAFYLLGWAQFEHLVRDEALEIIDERVRCKNDATHAWGYVKERIKDFSVRKCLNLVFHGNPSTIKDMENYYTIRNDAAHDYKYLPKEVGGVSAWLQDLQDLVDKNFG